MLLPSLYKFVEFSSGILLTLILVGLFLRQRSRQTDEETAALRKKTADLKAENDRLRRQFPPKVKSRNRFL